MVPRSFTSSLLVLLLACALFKNSIAHSHQAASVATGATSVNQELSDNVVVARTRSTWIRGRKMMMEKELRKEEGVNGGSSETSGKGRHASEKSFGTLHTNRNVQKMGLKKLKAKTSDSINMETIGSSSLESSSSAASVSQEPYSIYQSTVESQRLLEDSIEAMGMMNMDYGHPRRKSPINNGHPANDWP